jgi:putative transposase
MVGYWRKRFRAQGVEGLHDEMRPGRPRTTENDQIAALPRKTIREKPENATHWTCRTIAEEVGLSKSTVHRV